MRHSSGNTPSLAAALFAGDEFVDSSALAFLLRRSLEAKEEEEMRTKTEEEKAELEREGGGVGEV